MNDLAIKKNNDALEQVLVSGNLSSLTVEQRLDYYKNLCDSLGLNPLTKPFEYITLNGKLTLYAKKDATDQLRKIHGVSITESKEREKEGIVLTTVYVKDSTGRTHIATGGASIAGLKGDALVNAYLKSETKAIRRATLGIVGLGFLDETEVESIPDAKPLDITPKQAVLKVAEPISNNPDDDVPDYVFGIDGRAVTGEELFELVKKKIAMITGSDSLQEYKHWKDTNIESIKSFAATKPSEAKLLGTLFQSRERQVMEIESMPSVKVENSDDIFGKFEDGGFK